MYASTMCRFARQPQRHHSQQTNKLSLHLNFGIHNLVCSFGASYVTTGTFPDPVSSSQPIPPQISPAFPTSWRVFFVFDLHTVRNGFWTPVVEDVEGSKNERLRLRCPWYTSQVLFLGTQWNTLLLKQCFTLEECCHNVCLSQWVIVLVWCCNLMNHVPVAVQPSL